jgi:Fur family ferric uptake transcriptional regulator
MSKSPCGRQIASSPSGKANQNGLLLFKKLNVFVEEKKLNHSASRANTLTSILSFNSHFSIQELVKKVQQKFPTIGAATVYRNMPLFIEAKILRESFSDKNGNPFYETDIEKHHDHIFCLDCEAVFEFHEAEIESAQDRVSKSLNFEPANHRHVIYAHCKLLAKKDIKK